MPILYYGGSDSLPTNHEDCKHWAEDELPKCDGGISSAYFSACYESKRPHNISFLLNCGKSLSGLIEQLEVLNNDKDVQSVLLEINSGNSISISVSAIYADKNESNEAIL